MAIGQSTKNVVESGLPIIGKKMMAELAAGKLEFGNGGSNCSTFAQRQMLKMGWQEGKGLGKNEQGMTSHIKVKKREENLGLGVEQAQIEDKKNQWWCNVYDKLADKIVVDVSSSEEEGGRQKKSSKKKKKKKKSKSKKKTQEYVPPTDEELFAATGGKLFGRRAYGSCNGKLKRDAQSVLEHEANRKKLKLEYGGVGEADEDAITSSDSVEKNEGESEGKSRRLEATKVSKEKKVKKKKSEKNKENILDVNIPQLSKEVSPVMEEKKLRKPKKEKKSKKVKC